VLDRDSDQHAAAESKDLPAFIQDAGRSFDSAIDRLDRCALKSINGFAQDDNDKHIKKSASSFDEALL
jgi:hypothetical protein